MVRAGSVHGAVGRRRRYSCVSSLRAALTVVVGAVFEGVSGSVRIACVMLLVAVLPAHAQVATQTFFGTVGPSDPRMPQVGHRKSQCEESFGSSASPYDVIMFSPGVDGRHIVSLSTGSDDYNAWHGTNFLLYEDSFDPANPLTNCIGSGGTFPYGRPQTARTLSRILRADTAYFVVTRHMARSRSKKLFRTL